MMAAHELLRALVTDINSELLRRGLPEWMRDAEDDPLKVLARSNENNFCDWNNTTASALMLVMILPEDYGGIVTAPALYPMFRYPDSLCRIDSGKPTSGRGIDNRRGNIIESLLSTLSMNDRLHQDIQIAWKMVYRAHFDYIGDHPEQERAEPDMGLLANTIFRSTAPIDDEQWWRRREGEVNKAYIEEQRQISLAANEERVKGIFVALQPEIHLRKHRGEEITHRALAEMTSVTNHRGKTVVRLKEMYDEWSRHITWL